MADPKAIGPAMAVALLTTLYGAFIANVLFLPMITSLEGYTAYEVTYRDGCHGAEEYSTRRITEEYSRSDGS